MNPLDDSMLRGTVSLQSFRTWLSVHHHSESEVWVACQRGMPPADGGLWYVDAVEQALCFGWIDSTLKRMPDGQTLQRFMPRSAKSHWTELNRARARRMILEGQMETAGIRALPEAAPFTVNADLLSVFRADTEAWQGLMAMPALYRRIRIDNIQGYQGDEQQMQNRMERLRMACREGRQIGQWNDYGRLTDAVARDYFLKAERIGFSYWSVLDEADAFLLWGNPQVTRFICASGVFTHEEVLQRLLREIRQQAEHDVQYWPIYHLPDGELIGCCGLHPHGEDCMELGFHLRPEFWHLGYATEAATAVIQYARKELNLHHLFAGHNPRNEGSRGVLTKLGFQYTGDEFYAPTGLQHPSYILPLSGSKE